MRIEKVRDDPKLPKHLRENHTPSLVALFYTVDRLLAQSQREGEKPAKDVKLEVPPGYKVVKTN